MHPELFESPDLDLLIQEILIQEQRARLTAETLLRATAAINSTLELNQVLDQILEQLQQVLRFDSACVLLIEDEMASVLAVHGHPHPEAALKVVISPADDLLTKEIVSRHEPIVIFDAQLDPRFTRLGEANYVRGWMGIPMILRGEVIGLLTIDSNSPGAYSSEDARLAQAIASQAALAVMNARLYESEREQRAIAQALREISLVLSSSLKSDVILAAVLEEIEQVLSYDSGRVMMIEDDCIRTVVHRGYERFGTAHLVGDLCLTVEETPNLHVMATTLRPHWVADIPKDPNWVFTDVSRHFGSWVGAPLIAHGRLFGFLSLEKTATGYYTAKHAARLEILAGHVAIALMNALTFGEMERASVTDFLTGTYNHRYFQQQLRRELDLADRIGYPVSLLMLDLDHFKTVNDTYGHLCGDRVLQLMASRLKVELRSTDHLARYGGEEYAVILPGTHLQAAREVGDRLRRAVTDDPFYIEGALDEDGRTHSYTIPLTVSIGAAAFPEHAQAPRELIAAADLALYRAKAAGRNCILMASL